MSPHLAHAVRVAVSNLILAAAGTAALALAHGPADRPEVIPQAPVTPAVAAVAPARVP